MKKLLLTCAMAVFALAGMAETTTKTFTDQLTVTVNDESTTQEDTVTVEELEDNYINFVLSNFVLKNGEDNMYVGNIEINNLFLSDKGDYKSFSYNANLKIKAGNMEGVGEDQWVGPELGNVPLILKGKIADGKLYVTIDIDMQESLQQTIYVMFGSDFPAATVASTKEYTDTRTAYGVTNFGENYGNKTTFNDDASSKAVIETLSNNDINFVLNGMPLGMGEQNMTLGDLSFSNIQVLQRNGYTEFSDSCAVTFTGAGQMVGMTMPAKLEGKYTDTQLYYTLVLYSEAMQMDMYFTFGTDFAPVSVSGDAKTYADNIVVTVDEESTEPIPANVIVEPLSNGGINFNLKNFEMTLEGNVMHVGNIAIEDLKLYQGEGYQYFNYNDNLLIQKGDKEGVAENDWVGPELGEIPLRMMGRITDDKLYVTIDIDMVSLDQIIHVTFGSEILPTGIQSVATSTASSSTAIYNLAGQRVARAQKGIYIISGKKVLK